MTLIHAVAFGLIEGITEFLPISSTAHQIKAGRLFGLPNTEALKSFEIAIQLGAIAAAILAYRKMILAHRSLWVTVSVAFVPTGILGFALHQIVKTYLLGNLTVVIVALVIGGLVLIGFERMRGQTLPTVTEAQNITIPQSLLIGTAQALALIPGVSRSAATVIAGMAGGMSRSAIVDFSFLLAIPTMAAATGLDLVKSSDIFSLHDFVTLGIGFISAFITAYAAIRWLLGYVRSHTFAAFGVYRIVLALVAWLFIVR